MTEALRIESLTYRYRRGLLRQRAPAPAVDGVDLALAPGEVLGLIGESGSGKTTLARLAAGLLRPDQGRVLALGQDVHALSPGDLRRFRRRFQLLFQSPDAHFNPGLTVRQALAESARLHRPGEPAADLVAAILAQVGLEARADALPGALSGGERRRASVARVLLARPDLVIADEPTTGLDAALKADLIDLLLSERGQRAHLLISHDLPLVAYAADRVAVMYAGRIIEELPASSLGSGPHHPYTRRLVAAAGLGEAPPLHRRAPAGPGARGCPFRGPCPHAIPACESIRPLPAPLAPGRLVACHAPPEELA